MQIVQIQFSLIQAQRLLKAILLISIDRGVRSHDIVTLLLFTK